MNVTVEQLFEQIGRLHVTLNALQAELDAAHQREKQLAAENVALAARKRKAR